MFNYPRRPYYNYRTDDMPYENSERDLNTIDSKRFWKLLRNLRRRQEDARSKQDPAKQAPTG